MGAVWGLVGKLKVHPSLEDHLVLIRECERVGELPDPNGGRYPVYKIKSVALIPISPSPPVLDQPLKSCPKHHVGNVDASFDGHGGGREASRFPFKALGGKFSQVKDSLKNTAGAATGIAAQVLLFIWSWSLMSISSTNLSWSVWWLTYCLLESAVGPKILDTKSRLYLLHVDFLFGPLKNVK